MFSTVTTGSIHGIRCILTQVEVDISKTMPAFDMVGMLSGEVKEARERVRVALRNTGIILPPVHITINISPANIRKEGTAYDLPIAVGILISLGHIPAEYVKDVCMIGELGLNGEVKPVRGVLPVVKEARDHGFRVCIIPLENIKEGRAIDGIQVIGVSDFCQVTEYFSVKEHPENLSDSFCENELFQHSGMNTEDFADVYGQEACKRAALIAAAGFHHMLISGPPGAGKTMIAKRIQGILPPLTMEECLEVSTVYSVSGLLDSNRYLITERPFMAPHHTTTATTLSGGGKTPRPGLFSLSHRGILFLDELPEFKRECIEVMRQPLEEKRIYISRSGGMFSYPADFMLIATANLCPCGGFPDQNKCRCSEKEIRKYQSRISGPIRDRIDIHVTADTLDIKQLNSEKGRMDSKCMREKVLSARRRQQERFADTNLRYNSDISVGDIRRYCPLSEEENGYMEKMFQTMNLSVRSYHKILKVARTIADLEEADRIGCCHLSEAFCYRMQEGV